MVHCLHLLAEGHWVPTIYQGRTAMTNVTELRLHSESFTGRCLLLWPRGERPAVLRQKRVLPRSANRVCREPKFSCQTVWHAQSVSKLAAWRQARQQDLIETQELQYVPG